MYRKMKNKLRGSRCYLCGAMDRVQDGGIGWRTMLRDQLSDLGIHWLDPTRKPINIASEDDISRKLRRKAKMIGDFEALVKEMKPIRCVDLRMVDICDWVAVDLNMDVHACGTYEEIFLANRQKKPVLIRVEQGKKAAPDWLFGTVPHEHIFSTWEEMFEYVREVANGCTNNFGRWYFFDWMGDKW